jgi:hypothetical protein
MTMIAKTTSRGKRRGFELDLDPRAAVSVENGGRHQIDS